MGERFGRLLQELREARGWTQDELGRYVGQQSTALGRPQSPTPKGTISAWESGRRSIRAWNAYMLVRVFEVTPEALGLEDILTVAVVAGLRTYSREQTRAHRRDVPPLGATIEAAMADDGFVAGGFGGGGMADLARVAYAMLGLGPIDAPVVEDLRRITEQTLDLRYTTVAWLLARQLHSHLVTLHGALAAATSTSIRREIVEMIGETSAAAALNAISLFNYGNAIRTTDHMRRLAHEEGSSSTMALGLGCEAMCYQNRLHGEHEGLAGGARAAIDLLDAAERAGGAGARPDLRAWLHSARSWEHATVGEGVAAHRDLDCAERAAAQSPGPTGLFTGFGLPYVLVAHGKVALMLGDARGSVQWFEQAIATAPKTAREVYAVQLASVWAKLGEPERSVDLLNSALDAGAVTGRAMVSTRIGKVVTADLADFRHIPTVRILRERLVA